MRPPANPFTADPLEYLFGLEALGIKLGLENMQVLCRALGEPQTAYPTVLIAGTNGKGSVAAMVDTALRATGYRSARYTSPHLISIEERFVIAGRAVARPLLAAAAADLRDTIERLRSSGDLRTSPTFFEATTLVAFDLFRREAVDLAVLEVGLGGRFDATNVARPVAAAIPSIDYDHQQYLGSSLEEIAFEKAGIIKPGMIVVLGDPRVRLIELFARSCEERGARLVVAGTGVEVRDPRLLEDGRTQLTLITPRAVHGPLVLALRGRHQVQNACTAVRLLEELELVGLPVNSEAVAVGLSETVWPGRLDLRHLKDGGRVLFDAAHNPAGAAALAGYLREVRPRGVPMVFGAMRDKDLAGMLRALAPCLTSLVCTAPATRRAWPAAELAAAANGILPGVPIRVRARPQEALEEALRLADLVCVSGSIYLVGEVLSSLGM
jgi:dihydrofolate synthase / folylpolyglutamate synthase